MKKGCLFIFSIFLLHFVQYAQKDPVPGYMGKRCVIGYTVLAHPSFPDVTESIGTSDPHDYPWLNMTHAATFEYFMPKRTSLCLGFQYSRLWLGYLSGHIASSYRGKGNQKYPALLNTEAITIGFKSFAKGSIAPLGRYFRMDVLVLFNKFHADPEGITHSEFGIDPVTHRYGNYWVPVKEKEMTLTSFGGGASIGLGRQRIFFDRLVVDSGIRLCIALAQDPANSSYSNSFNVTSRVFYNQFINFRLGIGFLAF
ncbi:MAG: hypothetical protein ACJ77K_09840 [Bacteroidia bacterium]